MVLGLPKVNYAETSVTKKTDHTVKWKCIPLFASTVIFHLSSPGPGGDPHPGAPAEAGQGQHAQHHPPLRPLHVPQPHLHHLRAPLHQPLRAHQEEQVPGLQPPGMTYFNRVLA